MDIVSHYPTTLGRVAAKTALAIVTAGYFNASLNLSIKSAASSLRLQVGYTKLAPSNRAHATKLSERSAKHGATQTVSGC